MEEYVSGADQRLHTQYEYDSNPREVTRMISWTLSWLFSLISWT